jgi:hypothetical protein
LPPSADPDALHAAWIRLSSAVRIELDVLSAWISGLAAGTGTFRPEAAGLAWGTGLYSLGLFAGLLMRLRGAALAALVPSGAILAAAFAYTGRQSTLSIAVFLGAALLLSAVQTQYRNERRWEARTMMYAEDIRLDFTVAAAVLVGMVMVLSYTIPLVRLGELARGFLDRGADPVPAPAGPGADPGDVIGLPRPTSPPPFFDRFRQGGLPRSHLIGAGPELADVVALTVRVYGEEDPGGTRYYWRGLNYEIYNGSGWSAGETETFRYPAGLPVPIPGAEFTRPVRQEIRLTEPGN